jgi:ATP-dependent Clp protease ATP-binding subunit ClpX
MADRIENFPSQDELEKELSDYLTKKYGCRIKVVSPVMVPKPDEPPRDDGQEGTRGIDNIRFDMKPEELLAYLDQYVIKQDDAKAILATKICTHYNRIKFQKRVERGRANQTVGRIKNNIILIGPTGVGKTYLIKLIAQKIGVPFVKGDATKFSETGYVGGDVEDLVRDLLTAAGDDVELAEHGIIYLDEIDKIASPPNVIGIDVSRTGVQRTLLKPMEETEVDLRVPHDPVSQMQAVEEYRRTGKREKRTVNTRNILFIMSGAFNDLAPMVRNRLQKQGIGFGATVQSKEDDYKFLKDTRAEDLITYGFESEFIGRLPVIAVLERLEIEDLYEILRNPNNPIILGKKDDFRAYGVDVKFTDEALRLLAEIAYQEKTGARGLVCAIERVLLPFEKKLPSTEIKYLVVTPEVVHHPEEELAKILEHPHDPKRSRVYRRMVDEERKQVQEQIAIKKERYLADYPIVFSPQRIGLVADYHLRTGLSLERIFDEILVLYNQITAFEGSYRDRFGFKIHFNEEAINTIVEQALFQETTAEAICRKISNNYDYAFRLIADRSGQTQFILPREGVVEPERYLNQLIRDTFHQFPGTSPESKSEE